MLIDTIVSQGESMLLLPATVVAVEGRRVRVGLPDRDTWARLAVTFGYCPTPGDEVLALGQGDAWYVVGVLESTAPALLAFPGDVDLVAPGGRLNLASGKGITIDAPRVELKADRLEMTARTLFQRLTNCYQWVEELWQARARRTRTVVEESAELQAGRVVTRARQDVTINGDKIYLG